MATTRIQRSAVWNTVQFALNGIMFVLLGEQLPRILQAAITTVSDSGHRNPWWLAVYAVAITLGLAALRFVWVWVSLWVSGLRRRRAGGHFKNRGWRVTLATSLAGVRGAITLAGILTLPLLMPDGSPFPVRGLAIYLAAAVIVLSLVGASIGLPSLLKGLNLPHEHAAEQAEDHARTVAARAAIESIRKTQEDLLRNASPTDVDICTSAASRVIALYERRIQAGTASNAYEARQLRKADSMERTLRLAGLQGERAEIHGLVRHHRISDEISRKLVGEIDLIESRYLSATLNPEVAK